MSSRLHVTLNEVVEVASEPLSEAELWALLKLAAIAVKTSRNGPNNAGSPRLLVTPETLLLYPGGRVEVLPGLYDSMQSQFKPPELNVDSEMDLDKAYVYGLGATLYATLESRPPTQSPLHQLLEAMIATEPAKRPSLQSVLSACAHHSLQQACVEVDSLVSLVLGIAHDVSYSDEEVENLDHELLAAEKWSFPEELQIGFSSARPLQRCNSTQSVETVSLARLSVSSMPLAYHSSVQEGLDTTSQHSLHRALSLTLQHQDIGLLASKARLPSRRLPPDPALYQNRNDLRRTASLSASYSRNKVNFNSDTQISLPPSPPPSPPPSSTPSSPPTPPPPPSTTQQTMVWPEEPSMPLITAFHKDTLLDDFPSMPPPPSVPPPILEPCDSSTVQDLTNTTTTLDKIDSILQIKPPDPSLPEDGSHISAASFDYSDLEINKSSSTASSEEEFEFPPPPLPEADSDQESENSLQRDTERADGLQQLSDADRGQGELSSRDTSAVTKRKKDNVESLYATVDKRKKTKRFGRADLSQEREQSFAEIEEEEHVESDDRPPLLPPCLLGDDEASSMENRFSGVYEEVEARSIQAVISDSSGYTEVAGSRTKPELQLSFSGTGSLNKLRHVLGPAFSTMTGEKVSEVSATLPSDRRAVEVVLLNGKAVEFVVGVTANTSQLLEQVVSYLTLQDTHLFGLTVRTERDDIFLDAESKLVKHGPTGWTNCTNDTPFTVFFQVKFYVENISQLRQPLSQHLYYLQLRKDLMEGKMFCHEEPALRLAALAMQADMGDSARRVARVRVEDYLPSRIVEKFGKQYLGGLLSSMHKERLGLSRTEAELEFLKEAQKLPEYGMLFYRVAKAKHGEIGSVWLGFCVRGVVVFDVHREAKTAIQHCAWRKTSNISFSHRKFVIELQDNPNPLVYYASSYKRARYLLELSKACHKFHLVWAKKSQDIGQREPRSSPTPDRDTATQQTAEAVVEYPSPSRPSSLAEDVTHSIPPHTPSVAMETVRVALNRGNTESFGFTIAGSTQCVGVYVVKVVAGGVADHHQLLTGDRIRAVDGQPVNGYRETQALLQKCGSQLVIEVERKASTRSTLPPGESMNVEVRKEAGVVGVRIAGGSDKPFGQGLIRIKQVTADTASSRSGTLKEGDIILQVNSLNLQGMTHRQAADAILQTEDRMKLILHRPTDPQWWRASQNQSVSTSQTTSSSPPQPSPPPSPPSPPTPPPPMNTKQMPPESPAYEEVSSCFYSSSVPHLTEQMSDELSVSDSHSQPNLLEVAGARAGDRETFDITLRKSSLGFGFRLDKSKSDRDGCGVFILAINNFPAKSCSMLQAGDEIVSVDGFSLINHTHLECLQALRGACGVSTLTIRSHHNLTSTDVPPPLPPPSFTDNIDQ